MFSGLANVYVGGIGIRTLLNPLFVAICCGTVVARGVSEICYEVGRPVQLLQLLHDSVAFILRVESSWYSEDYAAFTEAGNVI